MTCVCVHHTSWPVRSRDTYTETCRERHNFQSELSGAFPRLFSCMCVTTLSSFLSHCTHILSVRVSLSLSLSHTLRSTCASFVLSSPLMFFPILFLFSFLYHARIHIRRYYFILSFTYSRHSSCRSFSLSPWWLRVCVCASSYLVRGG